MSKTIPNNPEFTGFTMNANLDMPFHDYNLINAQSTDLNYVVGDNQVAAHGDQRKRFVSKSTLIFSTADTHVHFNNSKNVPVAILKNTWYEFKSNIYEVFYDIPGNTDFLKLYFEGCLPQESRSPE
jgi:hypothetical protein